MNTAAKIRWSMFVHGNGCPCVYVTRCDSKGGFSNVIAIEAIQIAHIKS